MVNEARLKLAKTIAEERLLLNIIEFSAWHGWRSIHFRPLRAVRGWRTPIQGKGARGWPDLVLLRPPRLLFVELKAHRGTLDECQVQWLAELVACGAEVYVWTPTDWLDGTIERLLKQGDAGGCGF